MYSEPTGYNHVLAGGGGGWGMCRWRGVSGSDPSFRSRDLGTRVGSRKSLGEDERPGFESRAERTT